MVAETAETCRWVVISLYDKTYYLGVRLLVCYVSVNSPQCTDMAHIKLLHVSPPECHLQRVLEPRNISPVQSAYYTASIVMFTELQF
jgi:hypothetical protein